MNLTNAVSEPYVRLHEFREAFDRNIRVAHGGLQMLRALSTPSNDGSTNEVEVPSGDEPWGQPRKWKNIQILVPGASRFLSHMGIVRVLSAFEDFLGNVKAEHDRFAAASDKFVKDNGGVEEDTEGLRALCQQLGWNTDSMAHLLPLFDYFVLARNSIVHRDGRASQALVSFSTGDLFKSAVGRWNKVEQRPLPAFPSLEVNRELAFFPRHAVLASIVCNRLAFRLDAHLIGFLGEAGMTHMAAYHALLGPELRLDARKTTADAVINRTLFERYRVQEFTSLETIAHLKGLNKWKACYRRLQAAQSKK